MPDQFSVSELPQHLAAATTSVGDAALILIQGFPETRLIEGAKAAAVVKAPNTWEDFFDIRVFASTGEWHAWNLGGGQWAARYWKPGDHGKDLLLSRELPLWGSRIEKEEKDGWACISEASGAQVWVPRTVAIENAGGGRNRPLAILEAVEIIGFQEDTGLAGIIDFALRKIKSNPYSA